MEKVGNRGIIAFVETKPKPLLSEDQWDRQRGGKASLASCHVVNKPMELELMEYVQVECVCVCGGVVLHAWLGRARPTLRCLKAKKSWLVIVLKISCCLEHTICFEKAHLCPQYCWRRGYVGAGDPASEATSDCHGADIYPGWPTESSVLNFLPWHLDLGH